VFGAGGTGGNASVDGNGLTIVPVRISVTESQTVQDFLAAIQQQAIDMISYEHIGLQQIALLSADARHACDFQTLLMMQLADDNELEGKETLTPLDTPYALTLHCILMRKGLRVVASFNPRITEPWQ
jgi:hypothetical protein